MPAYHVFGTDGATGGGLASYHGTIPMFLEDRHDQQPWWSWQRRSSKTWKDRNQWAGSWPRGTFGSCAGDPAVAPYGPVGLDNSGSQGFEPFSCDGDGSQNQNFLRGTCKDSGGVAVANATVQAFRTSDGLFAGVDTSRNDGTYGVGVQQGKSTQHYLVAYKAGSPDISGTTVNTLLPTNVDGT